MKKVGLITLLMVIGLYSLAQIGMWLGGTAGFMTNNEKDGFSSSAYMFGPQLGYMLGEKARVPKCNVRTDKLLYHVEDRRYPHVIEK